MEKFCKGYDIARDICKKYNTIPVLNSWNDNSFIPRINDSGLLECHLMVSPYNYDEEHALTILLHEMGHMIDLREKGYKIFMREDIKTLERDAWIKAFTSYELYDIINLIGEYKHNLIADALSTYEFTQDEIADVLQYIPK